MLNNATIIIRSANERTEQLCRKLILEQGINEKNLFIIREVPFSASLHKSFETGINNNLPWTLCIDADVLLCPGSIKYMLEIAQNQKDNTFGIQCLVMDKFFGGPRSAGNHLYRTSFLDRVIMKIPAEGVNVRPETYALNRMRDDGFQWRKIPRIIGIHDHEQYNYDIYRKCFVHGVKHLDLAPMLKDIWYSYSRYDNDFTVALKAFSDSLLNTNPVYINRDLELFKSLFAKAGFKEKNAIDVKNYSLSQIEDRIINWDYHEAYLRMYPARWGIYKREPFYKRIIQSIKQHGIIKTIRKIFGKGLIYLGEAVNGKEKTNNS